MTTNEEMISLINQHEGFSQDEKSVWIGRVQAEGLTDELKTELKELLQKKIDEEYNELGIELDESSSEYKEAQRALIADIDTAEKQFKKEAEELKKQADDLQKNAAQEMDAAMADAARQAINDTTT